MADSRRSAHRIIYRMQKIVDAQKRLIYFLLSLISAFLLTYYVSMVHLDLSTIQQYVFFILLLAVALWVTEAIPPFAVGLLIVGLLIFLIGQSDENMPDSQGYIDVKTFVGTWSNSVIWLMLGGFFLALGLKKTQLDKELFALSISKAGKKPANILLSIMLSTALASMVMSNTATTAMMIASMIPFIDKIGASHPLSRGLLIGIPAAAALGGLGTIIGSPPNAIAVEAINNMARYNAEIPSIGFLEWMYYGVPLAIVLVLLVWFALLKMYRIPKEELEEVMVEKSKKLSLEEQYQRKIVLVILCITVFLWLTEKWHGIPSAAISGIPIILLPMVGIISGDEVREIPWDTLMLVAGGLSLGLAIQESKLAEVFVIQLKSFSFNGIALMLIFAFSTVIFSNIMSNTATATILIPIAGLLAGANPVQMAMIIGLSASCALFLPVSTPPNAIAFGTGYVKQSEFRVGGLVAGVVGPILAILWVYLIHQWI